MESTPRPITGYPRDLLRMPLPLGGLARGLRRLARPQPLAIAVSHGAATEALVQVQGGLTAQGAPRLKLAVAQLTQEGASQVTIDLSEASRIDPAGVAALVEVTQRSGPARILVVGLGPEARLLLEKACLHTVIEIGD